MSDFPPNPPGLFVTGTDTDVGKTYVTALLARRLREDGKRVGVYKPAVSGAEVFHGDAVWADVEALRSAAGLTTADDDAICPQRFAAPLAPPVAAAAEGRAMDADLLTAGAAAWAGRCDALLVEGAGGLLCPLAFAEGEGTPAQGGVTVADAAAELGFPLLVVARAGLGTVNHTLLTLAVAAGRGLTIAGVILNAADRAEPQAANNAAMIARFGGVRVLGVIGPGDGLPGGVDWGALPDEPRPSGSRPARR